MKILKVYKGLDVKDSSKDGHDTNFLRVNLDILVMQVSVGVDGGVDP